MNKRRREKRDWITPQPTFDFPKEFQTTPSARAHRLAEGELMRSHLELVMERNDKIHFWTRSGLVTAKLGSREKTTQNGDRPRRP
jgi:hypothetical protein